MIGAHVGTIRAARIAGPGGELLPDDDPVDIVLAGGRIADIAPTGVLRAVGEVLDVDGAWIVPGLWDHHVHVLQAALAGERAPLGHAASAAEAAAVMGSVTPEDGRRVGTGFRDAFWPDAPSLDVLDRATGEVPTYLINADVHSVWLNSAALRRERFPAPADGVLREADAFEISRRLNAVDAPAGDRRVSAFARAAAARGVVGIVDLDMAWNHDAWQRRAADGFDGLRIRYGIYPEHLDLAISAGLRTDDPVDGDPEGLVRVGGLKVITDGSLGTRTAACSHAYAEGGHGVLTVDRETLLELMTRATAAGLECAVHAIGDVANTAALDAFAATGASGSIEHAQLVRHTDIPRFARLGVSASVQPEHALDDRDLVDTVWAAQTAQPYPLRSLADAGANLLLGSDAPVTPLDPWAAMAGAVFRTRDGRDPWLPHERLPFATALAASTAGGSRAPARIEPGAVADLAVCATDPRVAGEAGLRSMEVRTTLVAGRVTHAR
ncbi:MULTISPECIES: amidohydrolase family protein [Microbacterium]|uniref:Metal-dependent hydrolase n=1 Tax=Microbacterium wangchenii TaxID=2541726 RepID=A0ABX5SVX8_9MICO|nr:amidohydrolase family protein [Microbacterium sp. EYE_512]QBR88974.1 metal-dependent hydrolase [Microbacterium wangchenii]TXK20695.1 amidohydrolase family protein [Microbacterium wangchenii]